MPSLWDILWLAALGIWDFIVVHTILPDWLWIKPPDRPPVCWLWSYSESLWNGFRQSPSARGTWTDMMLRAVGNGYQRLAEWARDTGKQLAIDWTRSLLGGLRSGYNTFANWINSHDLKIGGLLPPWCFNLIDGLSQLWDRLPQPIRDRVTSWGAWIDSFIAGVRNWAIARYDQFRQWADQAWRWATSTGETLHTWWNGAYAWLDDFRFNAYARIRDWLGNPWQMMLLFANGALGFWYNLWAGYGSQIGGLLTDPLRWLYDRAEGWIVEKVW